MKSSQRKKKSSSIAVSQNKKKRLDESNQIFFFFVLGLTRSHIHKKWSFHFKFQFQNPVFHLALSSPESLPRYRATKTTTTTEIVDGCYRSERVEKYRNRIYAGYNNNSETHAFLHNLRKKWASKSRYVGSTQTTSPNHDLLYFSWLLLLYCPSEDWRREILDSSRCCYMFVIFFIVF